MSLLGECRDINGLAVKHGLVYVAGPGECHQCICESGVPKRCEDVMCHQPENCTTFRKGARCCDFVCLDDIPPGKATNLDNDFGLRLVASVVTAILSLSLLFFLIHRLRQRKIRSGRQNRPLNEDERSLGSIGYITGSLGYLQGPMERYEEQTAHFPHYRPWKPPGNYFPRGEAPPPYEEAVAATRAEALAAAMASGNLHASPANFSREAALLGVSYNTYAVGNFMGGTTHRTIPMNLATSASFTLQPERFDNSSGNGGAPCASVAAGTVSVTATVTAPPLNRSDMINTDVTHPLQVGDSSICSSAPRRSDACPRFELPHRSESSLRADVGHFPEIHRSGSSHHPETVLKNQRRSEESSARPDTNRVRADAITHKHDFGSREIDNLEDPWRQNPDCINHQRIEDRRLSALPPSDNSHSLPHTHYSHGIHHHVTNFNHLLHQPATIHSHTHGLQHQNHQLSIQASTNRQTGSSLMDAPAPVCEKDFIGSGNAKLKIPQYSSIPKSGTAAYEDSRSPIVGSAAETPEHSSHTAPHRRNKLSNATSNGVNSLTRRGLKSVPAPALSAVAAAVSSSPGDCISPLQESYVTPSDASLQQCSCLISGHPRCNCHNSNTSLSVRDLPPPQNSDLSLNQSLFDDNDDYRSECENCKSTHSSNYYLDAEDPEPEITMTLHRKPTESGEENGNSYYRTSLTLPTRHRVVPLHGSGVSCGGRDNWFSSMPETSSDESEEE